MNDQLTSRLQILEELSRQVMYVHGDEYSSFRSQTTQQQYGIESTDPVLVRPILRMRKVYLVQSLINMYVSDSSYRKEFLLDRLSTARAIVSPATGTPDEPTLRVYLAQVYADNVDEVGTWLIESGCYEDLLKKHKGIKEVFINNIYNGSTDAPTESVRDFVQLGLYKNKETDELVLVTNYALHKKYQNKYGMLNVGNRPKDSNFLILLGLVPAFIPAFKERLTADEVAFFKLLTTPVKVYHERNSVVLYEQLIYATEYDILVRQQKSEKMRIQFRKQEERMFSQNISQAQRNVSDLVLRLTEAEVTLINAEKEMAYYMAGDSKLEDAVSYIFDHAYLLNVDYNSGLLHCMFRVPLAQWDPEVAETILKGVTKDPYRYNLEGRIVEDIKKFIQYILIEQVAKYWILAEFDIEMNSFQYSITKLYWNSGNNFRPEKGMTYKAGINPHMEYHSCTGSYSSQIFKAQQRKDLPGLIESLLAPYKCWNLTDGVVQGKMFKQALPNLINYNIPCIEYKGTMMDIHTFFNQVEEDRKPKVEPTPVEPVKKKRPSKARVLGEAREITADTMPDDTADAIRRAVEVEMERTEAELEEELRTQAEVQRGEDNDI
jgi:hypothetical protein